MRRWNCQPEGCWPARRSLGEGGFEIRSQNASEAIRDALRVFQRVRREDALKLKFLRKQIRAGADALERGEFVDVHDADLDAYLDGLVAPALTRTR